MFKGLSFLLVVGLLPPFYDSPALAESFPNQAANEPPGRNKQEIEKETSKTKQKQQTYENFRSNMDVAFPFRNVYF